MIRPLPRITTRPMGGGRCLADGGLRVARRWQLGRSQPLANTHIIKLVDSAGQKWLGDIVQCGHLGDLGQRTGDQRRLASDISGWTLNAGAGGGSITGDAGTLKFLQGAGSVVMSPGRTPWLPKPTSFIEALSASRPQLGVTDTKIYIGKSGGPPTTTMKALTGGCGTSPGWFAPRGKSGCSLMTLKVPVNTQIGTTYLLSRSQPRRPPAAGWSAVWGGEPGIGPASMPDSTPNDLAGYDLYLASA